MTYIKLHDGFFQNPKSRAVGMLGRALYVASLCYCGRNETDGLIAWSCVDLVCEEAEVHRSKRTAAIGLLVAHGLWVEDGADYRVHDYLAHQRSAADIERARARSRRSTAAYNRRKSSESDRVSDRVSDRGVDRRVTTTEAEAEAEHVKTSNGSSSAALHVLPNEPKLNRRVGA